MECRQAIRKNEGMAEHVENCRSELSLQLQYCVQCRLVTRPGVDRDLAAVSRPLARRRPRAMNRDGRRGTDSLRLLSHAAGTGPGARRRGVRAASAGAAQAASSYSVLPPCQDSSTDLAELAVELAGLQRPTAKALPAARLPPGGGVRAAGGLTVGCASDSDSSLLFLLILAPGRVSASQATQSRGRPAGRLR